LERPRLRAGRGAKERESAPSFRRKRANAMDGRRAGVVEAVAPPASDGIEQVHMPTAPTTHRTFPPGAGDAFRRLVPDHENAIPVELAFLFLVSIACANESSCNATRVHPRLRQ
jgi:hypothetical protein